MELVIGIDVGKFALDIYADGLGQVACFENTAEGISALHAMLDGYLHEGHSLARVLCEATGGYERQLVVGLQVHGIEVDVAHATHVRDFARASGQWAKTDRIDAAMIARYGRIMQPRGKVKVHSPELLELRALLSRRANLIAERIAESNRLDKHLPLVMRQSIERHIAWLKDEVKLLDKALRAQVTQSVTLNKAVRLLTSIPGVGFITAATMVAELPELGHLDLPKLTALVGLAPYNRDSGGFKGKRYIKGGRHVPRGALYMAALASLHHNRQIRAFYDKLTKAGKPPKLALIACARKLLGFINAVAKRNQPWTENYA